MGPYQAAGKVIDDTLVAGLRTICDIVRAALGVIEIDFESMDERVEC